MLARRADALKRRNRTSGCDFSFFLVVVALKAHAVMSAACAAVYNHPLAQRIDDRRANAMQTAGIRIILMIELTAGVQLGIDDLHAGDAQFRVNIHRNTASVILDRRAAVLMQLYGDASGVAVGDLVDRVIHDLPKQMMQTAGAGRTDVHARTHPNRIQPFKHLEHAGRVGFRHE